MLVKTFMVQGAGAAVASRLATLSPSSLDALVLFSLGADHSTLLKAVQENSVSCPVYLTETYGILGYDDDLKQNVELMEKGRGSEYGFEGGSGGQGCLVAGFSDGAVAGHTPHFPAHAKSVMVIADQSKEWAKVQNKAPVQYGGITKTCWKVTDDGKLEPVNYFWIADSSKEPVGVATLKDDVTGATRSLLQKIPSDYRESGSVGLFPCFTRGVNQYGAENVESQAIGEVIDNVRIYGMFAHGELGPNDFNDFTKVPNHIVCSQHSMASILSIHTKALN